VVPGTFLSASRDGLTTVVCGDQEYGLRIFYRDYRVEFHMCPVLIRGIKLLDLARYIQLSYK